MTGGKAAAAYHPYPPPGTIARSRRHPTVGDDPGPAVDPLPRTARALLDAATEAGWEWAVNWGRGHVSIRVADRTHATDVMVGWHDKGWGSLRMQLRPAVLRGTWFPRDRGYTDMGLAEATRFIREHPAANR